MICRVAGAFFALTSLSVATHAESAPRELYGKSVEVAWTESFIGKRTTDSNTLSIGSAYRVSIYVSGAGRSFVRVSRAGYGGSSYHIKAGGNGGISFAPTESGPEDSSGTRGDHVTFEGHSIVVYREFESGARRILIDVSDATTCKASVVNGKLAGQRAMRQMLGRGIMEITSLQVGTVSCSMREGNVFGGQQFQASALQLSGTGRGSRLPRTI
jgi:hypothetical protein